MWGIIEPDFSVSSILDSIIPKIRSVPLRTKYSDVRELFIEEEHRFGALAAVCGLGQFLGNEIILEILGADEIISSYDTRMAKDGSAARDYYDKILALAPHGRCPFCGHRDVQSLDHTMPKRIFSTLAVVPSNLVPCCSRCNQLMGQGWGHQLVEQFFNPYVENCEDEVWLSCQISPSSPAGIAFRVEPPASWELSRTVRANRQFAILRLGPLYSAEAAGYLANLRVLLATLLEKVGADGVRDELALHARSFARVRRNSWQRAFYEAASRCEWFCEGGFMA